MRILFIGQRRLWLTCTVDYAQFVRVQRQTPTVVWGVLVILQKLDEVFYVGF